MPAASIVTSFLNPPFNRKVNFHNAFATAMEAAGFPASNIDTYDITDTALANNWGAPFQSGGNGSIRGFVKELTYNASANGIAGIMCFTRTVQNINVGGSGTTNPYTDSAFMVGGFGYSGGWNSSTKQPAQAANGRVIGSYSVTTPFSTSLSASDTYALGQYSGIATQGAYFTYDTNLKIRNIFNYLSPIKFTAINHPEIRGVYIQQLDKIPCFIGLIRPATPPSWLNEANFPYFFTPLSPSFFSYRSFFGAANPWSLAEDAGYSVASPILSLLNPGSVGGSGHTFPGIGYTASNTLATNPVNTANSNLREIYPSVYIMSNGGNVGSTASQRWMYGQYSADVALTLGHGLQLFDRVVISPGTEEYMVITGTEYQNRTDSSTPLSSRVDPANQFFSPYAMLLRVV